MSTDTTTRSRGRGADSRRGTLYKPLGWVLVRAPTLPVETYLGLAGEAPFPVASIVATDPLVSTAIAVSSPGLLKRHAASGDDTDERLDGKLLRYMIRMSTRPTPFGLFAGVGLAELGTSTEMRVGSDAPHTRTRPDMAWLLTLIAALEERPEIRRQLKVTTSPNVWTQGGRAFVSERWSVDGLGGSGPVSIRATGVARSALTLAQRSTRWGDLAAELLRTPGATADKVDELLTQLWRQTFLMTELRPPLTHTAPARYVAERLAAIEAAAEERGRLVELLDSMAAWDRLDWPERPAELRRLHQLADTAAPGFAEVPVQVDASLGLEGGTISAAVGNEAAKAAELLLTVGFAPGAAYLDSYRQDFVDRYGVDREVPLLELLDPYRGLGPPSAAAAVGASSGSGFTTRREATLRRVAVAALRDRKLAIELDDATISHLSAGSPAAATSPVSVDLSVFVLAESAAAVDRGDFRLLIGPNLGGQAAGRNLGRFADLLGPPALAALATAAAAEIACQPEAIHAELVYLPRRGRSANVAIRPSTYDYEVAVSTTPNVDADHAAPLSELLVSVRDNRLAVRWPGRNGHVLVHAGHMLTSREAPIACRFLEDVTRAGRVPLTAFDWGPVADLPFLPRVQCGRIILAPARWRVDATLRDEALPPDDEHFGKLVDTWRAVWQVPDRVYLAVGDNRLLLDLRSPAHVEQLRSELGRLDGGAAVIVQEPLPGPEHAWLQGPHGHHLAELVVPLAQRPSESSNRPAVAHSEHATATRSDRIRPPGSDWLYAKLYGPPDGQDELLAGELRTFGEFALGSGIAERWFFVRYADPESHVRLRFGGVSATLLGDLLPSLCVLAHRLIDDGACSSLAFDTYEREIERFGGTTAMTLIEELFAADSTTVVDLLHLERIGELELDRTELAVLTVDDLLRSLGLDDQRRASLYRAGEVPRPATGGEYRQRKESLRRLLAESGGERSRRPVGPLAGVLHARSRVVAPLSERLRSIDRAGELTKSFDAICASVVHMHCNRLLGAGPPSEPVVLGLLSRTMESLSQAPLRPADGRRATPIATSPATSPTTTSEPWSRLQ